MIYEKFKILQFRHHQMKIILRVYEFSFIKKGFYTLRMEDRNSMSKVLKIAHHLLIINLLNIFIL